MGIGRLLRRHRGFNLRQHLKHSPVAVVQIAHVRCGHSRFRFAAEEKFKQKFIARRLVVKRQSKPLAECRASRIGDYVGLAALAPIR